MSVSSPGNIQFPIPIFQFFWWWLHFCLETWFPVLNALVICWPLQFKSCEQGITRLHANGIIKQLILCTSHTIFYLICSLSYYCSSLSKPWKKHAYNKWLEKQALAFRLDHRLTPYGVTNLLLRHNTFKCTKLGKGDFFGERIDGSLACAETFVWVCHCCCDYQSRPSSGLPGYFLICKEAGAVWNIH